MNTAADPAPIRFAPLALWRVAEAFLRTLHMLFGAPEKIAEQGALTAKAHARLASWLRCAEAMMRRLLAIEAAAYPKPNTRPLLHQTKLFGRQRARKLMTFTADAPEKWRVSFRCFSSPTLRQAQRDAECGAAGSGSVSLSPSKAARPRLSRDESWYADYIAPPKLRSAWPLAERFEALIRVFNDPAPYARRLAHRLHATPHRITEALRAPPEAKHRVERIADMGDEAEHRWRPHRSSG